MTVRILPLKDNLNQNKLQNQNALKIYLITLYYMIQDIPKSNLIIQLSSSMFLTLEIQKKLLMNTAVKSSWEVNTPLLAITSVKIACLQLESSSI